MAFPCNQFGAQEPGSRCCVNDHNAHNDGNDMCSLHLNITPTLQNRRFGYWRKHNVLKEVLPKASLNVVCWMSPLSVGDIWRFGRFRWIPRLWDLIGEDPTWIEKIHQRQNTNPKNHLSRKVKTHHLQDRAYFFWVPAVHLLFGSFIYRQFINHLDRQARLRRSRVLSWTLGGFFVFFGWRLVHPKGWLHLRLFSGSNLYRLYNLDY